MLEANLAMSSKHVSRASLHAESDAYAQPRVLLVEDDHEIARMSVEVLKENGFDACAVSCAREMDTALARERIDLVVLDVMLPGEDGLSVCRRLRAESNIPIIMLSARSGDADRIVGLEIGADDYIIKPFNSRELVARIRALVRRARLSCAGTRRARALSFDGWRLDPVMRQLHDPRGIKIAMTSVELDLLLTLCRNAGRVLTREDLIKLTPGFMCPIARSIDVHVSRIRHKIEPDPRDPTFIKTVRLGGYVFTPIVAAL